MTSPGALETATAVLQRARELAEVDWDSLDGPDAVATAAELGRLKAIIDGALVAVAERLEETGGADALGWASTKDFLTHVLGGRKGAGATVVRVATEDRPAARGPRRARRPVRSRSPRPGVIGGRVATLPQVPELREQAAAKMLDLVADHGYDATDLDHAFPDVVRELDPDGSLLSADLDKDKAERGAHHARFLSGTADTLGGVRIKGYSTVEEWELVKSVLMPLSAPVVTEPGACGGDAPTRPGYELDEHGHLVGRRCPDPGCGHTGKDPRDHGVRMWDALVEACRRLQATDSVPHAHGTTARITVTIPLQQLLDQPDGHLHDGGHLPSGDRLSVAAVRRLACDAEIIPAVLGTEGQVLDVGRSQRLVTTGIWNALVLRDRHCAFPGCTRLPIACDAHHIQSTGPTADPPASTTWSCSAGSTTRSPTRPPGRSRSTPDHADRCGSHHPRSTSATDSPTARPDHDHPSSPEPATSQQVRHREPVRPVHLVGQSEAL